MADDAPLEVQSRHDRFVDLLLRIGPIRGVMFTLLR
jgi:hypothetical protein